MKAPPTTSPADLFPFVTAFEFGDFTITSITEDKELDDDDFADPRPRIVGWNVSNMVTGDSLTKDGTWGRCTLGVDADDVDEEEREELDRSKFPTCEAAWKTLLRAIAEAERRGHRG